MADDAQSPVPSNRAPDGTVQLVSPYDQRVYTVPSNTLELYTRQGFVAPSTAQVNYENIRRTYEHSWRHKAEAVGEGIVAGIPGATTLASKVLPTNTFNSLAQDTVLNQTANPGYVLGGKVLGGVGAAAGLVATGGALGGALGLGSAGTLAGGAELGGALLGETGAAAAGTGAEGALSYAAGEAGLDAATLGASEGGAAADATAALAKTSAPSWGQAAAKVGKGIAENAAIGSVFKVGEGSDNYALAHALDPNGQEHIGHSWSSMLDDAIDGAVDGAKWGAAFEALGPALKSAAAKLGPKAQEQLARGLFDTQKLNEAMQGVSDTSIMQTVKTLKLTEQPFKKVAGSVDSALRGVEGRMNIFKDVTQDARMTVQDHIAAQGELDALLADSSSGQKFAKQFAGADATVQELQGYRRKLYDAVDYSRMDLPENRAFEQAGQVVKRGIIKALEASEPGVSAGQSSLANEWSALDEQYHNLSIIKSSLKGAGGTGNLQWLGKVAGVATAAKVGLTAIGAGPIGTAVASTVGLVKSVDGFKRFVTDTNLGTMNRALATGFDKSSQLLSKAVEMKLYGGVYGYDKANLAQSYPATAAKLNAWMQNREQGVQNLHGALQKSQVPGSMADPLASQAAAKMDYLAQAKPSPPRVAPDIVTHSQPDLAAQNRWMGQVRSMQDPKYAISHPTSTNLEVLRKFYPTLYGDTQQAVLAQVQNNPNLPLDSKLWAGRILGRPITPVATHMAYSVLTAARAQSDQAAAQGAQSGGGPQKPVQSSGTRLDALQNPQD